MAAIWAAQALRTAAQAAWARGAPDVAAGFLQRAAEEELPREALVPVLRELARARIATGGPEGLPVLREALALAGEERREIALELGHALLVQGYFSDGAAVFEQAGAQDELATVAVLDLALVRRFGGLEGLRRRGARAPAAVGAWIAVATRPPASARRRRGRGRARRPPRPPPSRAC